jgi:hypothetical protein
MPEIPVAAVFLMVIPDRRLRPRAGRCIESIFRNFFLRQYRAALAERFAFKKRAPLSCVEHDLDRLIPFSPSWIEVYLDFVGLWVRMIGFLLIQFGGKARDAAAAFMDSMGDLYRFAGKLYDKNLSTTSRPFYIREFRFFLLRLLDPHLMCVPSLHVMVVVLTYTRFRDILGYLDKENRFAPRAEEIRRGALSITEAILYVKQHSVNCVAAALYAMTRFEGGAIRPEEAESFVSGLFTGEGSGTGRRALPRIGQAAGERIREHILKLYRRFCRQGLEAPQEDWAKPLLDFLEPLRGKNYAGRRGVLRARDRSGNTFAAGRQKIEADSPVPAPGGDAP